MSKLDPSTGPSCRLVTSKVFPLHTLICPVPKACSIEQSSQTIYLIIASQSVPSVIISQAPPYFLMTRQSVMTDFDQETHFPWPAFPPEAAHRSFYLGGIWMMTPRHEVAKLLVDLDVGIRPGDFRIYWDIRPSERPNSFHRGYC